MCGGFVFGTASLRESIFRREMPLVLEAIRYGDRELFDSDAELDNIEVIVHFRKSKTEKCERDVGASQKIQAQLVENDTRN